MEPDKPGLALPEGPPGFIVSTEAQKAAFAHGFWLERGADGPWLRYASTTVPGEVWLAGRPPSGPWCQCRLNPGSPALCVLSFCYAMWRTRARRSRNPARPYRVRFSIFSRLICSSTGLVVHGRSSAA